MSEAEKGRTRRSSGRVAATATVPFGFRLAGEIVKPKDWPAFQRNCVILFREELSDPHAKEYGRNGQSQGGIDILGYRGADPNHAVGIQCRRVDKSLKHAAILKDCRAALRLVFDLREIIFVTTAPDDTKAEQAAKAVERTLRDEGRDVTVHVYGWGQLQTLIARHEVAYNAFMPSAVATTRPIDDVVSAPDPSSLAALIAEEVAKRVGLTSMTGPPVVAGPEGIGSEDPALHAKIDVFREMVREGEGAVVEAKLLQLRDSPEAKDAPWARYRIETNVAAALMDRGAELDAAAAYERAHAIRPDDPNAIANLAIARTIQGRPDEGMALARLALEQPDPVEFAVSALLQSAARSDWQGDPESLIPEGMRGRGAVEAAVVDFMRRRWLPGWEERALALPIGSEGEQDFMRLKALAVLSLAVDSRSNLAGGSGPVSAERIDAAATDLQRLATRCLRTGYAHRHDLMAHVGNAALLLRIASRREEAEALLREGLTAMPDEEHLSRLLAMTLIDADREDEAVQVLGSGSEPETVLMRIQFEKTASPAGRLRALEAMGDLDDARVAGIRRRLIAEFAFAAGDRVAFGPALAAMSAFPEEVVAAELLALRAEERDGLEGGEVRSRLRALVQRLPSDATVIDRFLISEAMLHAGLGHEAAELIEPDVDLAAPRPATLLYLTALADSRRDDAFRRALATCGPRVRHQPAVLWLEARQTWNSGDLEACMAALDRFLEQQPDEPRARLMRIEVSLRLGRSKQVLEELDRPIEDLPWKDARNAFRVAGLLSLFGYHDRAAGLAYRLFLQHRDMPRAWMTLSSLTIQEGRGLQESLPRWSPDAVGPHTAVDLEYDDGAKAFFVVEPDPNLRKLDSESWEPEHALVRAVAGLGTGDRFVAPDGREGRVAALRHKIVARFHYVLANYEARFPEVFGFRTITVDPDRSDGLDELLAQLKERHEWVRAEQERFLASGMPINVLAARLDLDTIDVAGGLAEQGVRLVVTSGIETERLAARSAVTETAAVAACWTCSPSGRPGG